jgi:hypothetical protein
MSPKRDPYFGRYAVTVVTGAVVVCVLGLAGIYYFFEMGGSSSAASGPLSKIIGANRGLAPNEALLYFTRDGQTLVGVVSNLGRAEMSPSDKATVIVKRLISGEDAGFLKSPMPAGTEVKSVFVNDNVAIVNLSRQFIENMGSSVEHETLAVYSVVNSLLNNIETVTAVKFLIEGQRLVTLRGNIDLEGLLIANAALTRAS